MKFQIDPIIVGKMTRLHVERIDFDDRIEHFKRTGKNKSITLQTNRLMEKIIEAIERKLI